jgi:outer membrane protein TolC
VRRYPAVIALSVVMVWNLNSQTVLTLDQCLKMAREYSPRLRSAQNTVRVAELSRRELSTTALPQVRLQATPFYAPYGRNFGYDVTTTDGGQLAGQIVVQQSLFDGGIRSLRSEQLGVDLERTGQEYRMADRDLTFSVKQAFLEALRSSREAQLENESVAQLADYLDVVKRLYNGGSASYTDVLKTDLQLSNARISYQKALDDFAVAKYSLAELIGRSVDTAFSIQGSLDNLPSPSTDSLLRIASQDSIRNVESLIADLEMQSGMLGLEMTRHESWPVVSLSGDAGYLSSGSNLKLLPSERLSAVGFGFGIVVDIPLVNWGATDLRVQQQQLTVNNLRLESERLQRSVTSQARQTRLQILRLRDRLGSVRQSLKQAEENFVLTKSKFVGGGTLSLEVLSAQQLLTETWLLELQTLADIQLLTAKLEQLTAR